MAQNDVGIDLGTTSIIIYVEGKGIVLNEPTIVAVDTRENAVLAVGNDAYKMVGRTPAHINAIFPLKDGVISNHTLTQELIKRFLSKVYDSKLIKPRVAVCVPSAITGIEFDAVVEAVMSAGARQVFLVDEPIAAAIGAEIDIVKPRGHMIIDIGGGTTDIAVMSLGGKVQCTSIKVAGNTINSEIVRHIRQKFSLAVGEKSAEKIKCNIGCATKSEGYSGIDEIKGRNLITGLPQRLSIATEDLYEPVEICVSQIAAAAKQVLEKTPPELAGDIFEEGVFLSGGAAKLKGLTTYLSEILKLKVSVVEDPLNAVAIGTGRSITMSGMLESGFVDATPGINKR